MGFNAYLHEYYTAMRLSDQERKLLYDKIKSFDPGAKVYLFGSRVHDHKKGGDIDILILTEVKLPMEVITEIRYDFMEKFGEQRMDILNFTFHEKDTFKELILKDSVEIS